MKKKQTLIEEIQRMQGLMSYKNGQYKNPIIREQEETKVEKKPVCKTISYTGTFPIQNAEKSNSFKGFIEKVKSTIKNDVTLSSKVKENLVYVTEFKVMGGASNFWRKYSVVPDLKNDRKTPFNATAPEAKKYTKDKNSPEYTKNKELAKNRAKGVAAQLGGKEGLSTINVKFKEGVLQDTLNKAEGFVIDTGGTNDVNTTGWKIPSGETFKPGQIVNIIITLCYDPILDQTQDDDTNDDNTNDDDTNDDNTNDDDTNDDDTNDDEQTEVLYECFNNSVIEVIYDKGDHNCDHAVYEVFANGYQLKRENRNGDLVNYASLNNKSPWKDKYDDAEIIKSNQKAKKTKKGGTYEMGRRNTFLLSIDGVNNEFFNADTVGKHEGKMVITAKCVNKGAGKWNPSSDCHKGVGKITITLPTLNNMKEEVIVKTPNTFGEIKTLADFPACENVVKVMTQGDESKIKQVFKWFKIGRKGKKRKRDKTTK
tara:strand:+ start:2992 stop:4437 length:1446 start_codon:yes stop_codon:yes gene_type:complete